MKSKLTAAYENDHYGKEESRLRHAIATKRFLGQSHCHLTLAANDAKCLQRMVKEDALAQDCFVFNIESDLETKLKGEKACQKLVGDNFQGTLFGRLGKLPNKETDCFYDILEESEKSVDSFNCDLCGHFTPEIVEELSHFELGNVFADRLIFSITVSKKRGYRTRNNLSFHGGIKPTDLNWSDCSRTPEAEEHAAEIATDIKKDLKLIFPPSQYNVEFFGGMNYNGGMMNLTFLIEKIKGATRKEKVLKQKNPTGRREFTSDPFNFSNCKSLLSIKNFNFDKLEVAQKAALVRRSRGINYDPKEMLVELKNFIAKNK